MTPPTDDSGTSGSAGSEADAAASGGGAASLPRRLLSPLVASKLRIALLVIVGLVALVGVGFFLGVFGVPEVAGVQNSFGNVSANETVVETNVTVSNPNPIGVSLGGVTVDYQVRMNDVDMANGTKEGISIGSGNSTLALETVMYNDRIPPWWVSHIRNGERTAVAIEADVSSSTLGQSRTFTQGREIETDLLGQFASTEDRPINANHPLVDDPILIVRETDANWGSVTEAETPIEMAFTVHNPNTEPYAISELRYEVRMNDIVVSRGATEDPFVIPGGSTNTLEATTRIQNQRLDEWWVSHLNESVYGHQVSRFHITFTAVVELPGGTTVTVPLSDLSYGEWIGTDIFSEGGDVGVPPDEPPENEGGGLLDGEDWDGSSGSNGGDGTDGNTSDGGGSDGDDGLIGDGSGDGSGDDSGDDEDGLLGGNETDGTL